MDALKTLLDEAMDNIMVAGSLIFLFIAFVAAIAEPVAALLPFVLGVGCYAYAWYQDQQQS